MRSILRPLPHKARTSLSSRLWLVVFGMVLTQGMPLRANTTSLDSVGVEQGSEGGTQVLHRVEAGETLYAIARRYQQTVESLQAANPGLDIAALRIGQVIRVPHLPATTTDVSFAAMPEPVLTTTAGTTAATTDPSVAELMPQNATAVALPVSAAPAPVTSAPETPSLSSTAPASSAHSPTDSATDSPRSAAALHVPPSLSAENTSRVDGQEYHLREGETLFSLSGTLDLPLSALLAANPGLDHRSMQAGSTIWVPKRSHVVSSEAAEPLVQPDTEETGLAESGPESATNPSQARQSNVGSAMPLAIEAVSYDSLGAGGIATTAGIKHLPTAALQHTVAAGETWYGIARQYGLTATALQASNPSATAGLTPGLVLDLPAGSGNPAKNGSKPATSRPVLTLDQPDRPGWTKSRGIATYLSDTEPDTRPGEHLALHNEAAIGSMIDVRNLMNNRHVSAKVVGRLPTNAADRRVVITLSPGAAQALRAHDPRVLVEVAWPSAEGEAP